MWFSAALISEAEKYFPAFEKWVQLIHSHQESLSNVSSFYYFCHEFIYLSSPPFSCMVCSCQMLRHIKILEMWIFSSGKATPLGFVGNFWRWHLLDGINGTFSFVKNRKNSLFWGSLMVKSALRWSAWDLFENRQWIWMFVRTGFDMQPRSSNAETDKSTGKWTERQYALLKIRSFEVFNSLGNSFTLQNFVIKRNLCSFFYWILNENFTL